MDCALLGDVGPTFPAVFSFDGWTLATLPMSDQHGLSKSANVGPTLAHQLQYPEALPALSPAIDCE